MISPARRDDGPPETAVTHRRPTDGGLAARMEAELVAAVTMLTRFPVRHGSGERTGAAAYAIVGSLVGLVASVPLVTIGAVIPPVAAGLAIASIAAVTGVIHLDGLADTADALVAVGPDGAERARNDPAAGVGGVVALLVVLGLEAMSLAILAGDASPMTAGLACVLAGGVSRGVPVVLARLTRHRARPGGLGGWFAARTTNTDAGTAVGSAVLLGLACWWVLGGPAVPAAGAVGGIGGLLLGVGLVRLRGQVDGDLLGASIELSFALTLVIAATLVGGPGW